VISLATASADVRAVVLLLWWQVWVRMRFPIATHTLFQRTPVSDVNTPRVAQSLIHVTHSYCCCCLFFTLLQARVLARTSWCH
jgi:hypothetical protein